jgi:hypothetical protein
MCCATAIFFLLNVSVPAAAADASYYPLPVGAAWTYKVGDQGDKFVISVAKTAKVGTQDCLVLEAKFNGKETASEHVAALNDGVYRFMYGDKKFEPAICFLKPNAKKGDAWQQEYSHGADIKGTIKFTVDFADVEVPAGKFKDALVVHAEAAENNTVSKSTMWFAKGVGMVKELIEDEKPIVLELEKTDGLPK